MNISAINSNYSFWQKNLINSLSSGKKINSAQDNPAISSIVTSLSSQAQSLLKAQNNATDGVSFINIETSGLDNVTYSLQNMRDLAVQSGNGTLNSLDRQSLQKVFDEQNKEINSTVNNSSYNGNNILNGSSGNVTISTNINGTNGLSINNLDFTNTGLGVNNSNVTTQNNSAQAISDIDNATNQVNNEKSVLGADSQTLENKIKELNSTYTNTMSSIGQMSDTDYAKATSDLSLSKTLEQAKIYSMIQKNHIEQSKLSFIS